jgi:hypothetical protein
VRVRGWTQPGEGKTQEDLRRETPLVPYRLHTSTYCSLSYGMILYDIMYDTGIICITPVSLYHIYDII